MPNLAYMFMGGLQAQQLPEKQQQVHGFQQPFSFAQTNMRAGGGYGWGLKPFQNPCLPRFPPPALWRCWQPQRSSQAAAPDGW